MEIPLKYIKSDSPIYIGLIGGARDFYTLTRKMDEEQKKKYVHIGREEDCRGRRFEKLMIISEYTRELEELERNAKFNLIGNFNFYGLRR